MRRASSTSSSFFYLGFVHRNLKSRINLVRSYCDLSHSHLSFPKRPGPLTQYRNLVEQGKLQHDPYQDMVALELDKLLERLEQYEKDMEEYHANLANWEKRRENERRGILVKEAEQQQGDIWTSVNKHRYKLVERWMFR